METQDQPLKRPMKPSSFKRKILRSYVNMRNWRLSTVDKYLLSELLVPFVFTSMAVLMISFVYILISQMSDFEVRNFNWRMILQYLLLSTPRMVTMFMPIALLVSLIYSLMRLAYSNEIVALRACGFPLTRIAWPLFAVALFASLLMFGMNRDISPRWEGMADAMLITGEETDTGDIMRVQVQYHHPSKGRFWFIRNFNVSKQTVRVVEIVEQDSKGNDIRKIYANEGRWNGKVWEFQEIKVIEFLDNKPNGTYEERLKSFPEFTESPELILASGREVENMGADQINEYIEESGDKHGKIFAPYRTVYQDRHSLPFSCLALALFTIPFAASATKRDPIAGVAYPLLIYFAMFFFSKFCLALGSGYRIPAYIAAWLPNLVFGGIGAFMFWRRR
ncbi:MAG: LptF/LptG family permease [Verrucomicrobiota bacterium]|nr:LptF/LptG family permease [Verrucomicrobiota bacterium]